MAGCGDCREGIRLWSYRAWIGAMVLLFSGWVGAAQAGTPVAWDGGTGIWSDPNAWNLGLIPNNNGQTYDVTIGLSTDDVSLDLSVAVDTVANAGTLRLLEGFSLTLAQPGGLTNTGFFSVSHSGTSGLFGAFSNSGFAWVESGTLELNNNVNNSGTIWMGDAAFGGSDARLHFLDDAAFTGSGELYFLPATLSVTEQPSVELSLGTTLTNDVDHRIHGGSGSIQGPGELVNLGQIDADIPLRTLTVDVDEFTNEGQLWARSGNLDVNVDNWINSGEVLVANGGSSVFTGSLLTNDNTGVIKSVGGAELTLMQSVTNFNSIATGGGGQITFGGASTVVSNFPGAVIDAGAGTIRFEASNGSIQNLGMVRADDGSIEIANGTDMFGGDLVLSNASSVTVTAGTTTLTQVRTSLDATSTMAVTDRGTGIATLTFDGIMHNAGGTLKSRSDSGGTTTFNLMGDIYDDSGTFVAEGGAINISNAMLTESGVLSLDMRNGGDISFTNVDSTASQINVDWVGTGGDLVFNDYWKNGTPTALDISGWSADGGAFTVSGGSVLTGSGLNTLPAGTTLTVTGANSSLSLSDLSLSPAGSLIDLVSGGTLGAPNLAIDGEVKLRTGTFDGNLTLNPSATFTATGAGNLVTGDFSWVGDRDVEITTATLGFGGTATVASGSSLRITGNSGRFNGNGVIDNSGVIEGGAPSTGNSTFVDVDIINNAGGVIRAYQNGVPTNTYLQLSGDITNVGLMEADGANLYFTGANVVNSGTIQALDNADGSKLMFLNSATVTDQGGTTLVDGLSSRLEVTGGANVDLGALTLSNGATGYISGANTVLSTSSNFNITEGTVFTVASSSRVDGTGVDLAGELLFQSSSVIDAPVTVNPTGQITANSGIGTLNGLTTVLNDGMGGDGRISLVANGARINGAGVISNNGVIEGGAPSSGNGTYLDVDVVNNSDGVIRAFQNGTPTNTYLYLSGDITNNGTMEADGANLYFTTGVNVQNSGLLRTVDNAVASKLMFLNGARVTDAGGSTQIDGALSTLEISAAADVDLGQLSFTNGGTGFVTGVGSVLSADMTINPGTAFTVTGSGRLSGTHAQVDGQLLVESSSVVDAPVSVDGVLVLRSSSRMDDSVTVNPTGQLLADSSTVTLNGPVTVLNDGMGGDGRISLSANSARINGAGVITNSGLVEGGATSNSQPTYLDAALVNNVDGVVRAYRNGTTTNTRFEMPDDITNAGVMEADGAHLYFSTGTNMLNSGTLRTVDNVDANSKLIFLSSAKVTNAGGSTQIDGSQGRLEVSGAADVELGQLTFTNGGTGSVTDASTVVTADTTINPGAAFTITSSGRLSGPHAQVDGQLLVQSSAVVDAPVTVDGELVVRSSGRIDAPVTVNPTGQLLADSSIATLNEAVTVTNDGMGGNGRISLVANSARINGAGLITNSGLIEGGATSSSQPTYLDNDLVNNADGIVRAFRNGTTSNTRFEMPDDITNAGVMEADGANLYFTTGTNMLNSGTLRTVNNVDANSKLIFLGSARVIDSGGTTQIDGSQSSLEVSGLADVELGTLSFTNGGTGYVTGASTVVRADTTINEGSTFSVQSSGRITGAGVALGGELIVQSSAVVDAPLTVNPTGQVTANSSIATFNKPVSVLNDGMGGAGTISIVANSARINGTGVITNSGVIEGGATSNNNSTYLDSEVVNNADGVLRAFSNGGATGTYFRLSDEVRNAGVMEGDGGNLYMTTATVANSGTMRALNGGKLTFIDGTKVANGGGSIHVMDTGTALVSGANTIVDSSAMQVDGSMEVYNATVRAPVTIGATGEVSSTYQSSGYPARFNGPMTIENGGTLSMYKYYTTVTGDGLITNHGLIRGASDHSSYPQTYLYNDVVNESDGVVRAEQNAAITNSRLQIYGDITNAGLMEANGGNLWFMSGSSVVNSGTLQAVDGNEIRIQGGVTVTDAGGSVLSLSNGGTAYITDANTVVTAQTSIADGSMLNLRNGALLSGTGVQVDGDMEVYNATVDAPVTISATGEVTSTYGSPSYPARFDAPMTIDNGGTLSMLVSSAAVSGNGLITNHGLIQGASNSNNTPTYLYNDVVNASDGVIRARQNDNGATNTYLQMYGDITNDGVMEADGARLYFSGATVQNSGTIRAVDHADGSRLIFASASRVTDAGGVGIVDVDGPLNTLEISGASNVQLGTFSLTNGATGFVSDANSVLTADMTIGDGSVFTARNSARITGPGVQVDGELVIQSSAVVDSGVTVAPTGQLTADYGTYSSSNRVTLNGPVTIQNDGMGGIGTVTMGGSYHSGFNGTGSITNNGLIEGGSTISGYSTFIDNDLVNNVDGVVRAFRNGETTNTYFQLRGDIVNAGLLEADGANLYFPGSVMQNSGTLRTVDNPAANSKLIFLGGATVTDAGGSTQLDGALSSLEVSGLADVELGSLSFSNGATGYVTGSGTVVTADTTIDAGATFSVMSSG
ncbi:MAG: hypothetical protein KAV82_10950, partial [Phycisphaerae bacterium]|nr:hypothetical protein [Phycisphaerae bacterium]